MNYVFVRLINRLNPLEENVIEDEYWSIETPQTEKQREKNKKRSLDHPWTVE